MISKFDKNQKCWEFLAISFTKCLPSLCIITKSGGKKPYEKPFQNSLHLEMYRGPYSFVFSASLHCDDFFTFFSIILIVLISWCSLLQFWDLPSCKACLFCNTYIYNKYSNTWYNKYTTLKSLKLRTFEFSFW